MDGSSSWVEANKRMGQALCQKGEGVPTIEKVNSLLQSLEPGTGILDGATKAMWRKLFQEPREKGKETHPDSVIAQGKLLEIAIVLMSSEQKRQMQEIVHKMLNELLSRGVE